MSYGAVVTDWRGLEDPDELLSRADMLMYEAKRRAERLRAANRRRRERRPREPCLLPGMGAP